MIKFIMQIKFYFWHTELPMQIVAQMHKLDIVNLRGLRSSIFGYKKRTGVYQQSFLVRVTKY